MRNQLEIRRQTLLTIYAKTNTISITETWLQNRDNAVRGELRPTGYQLINHPRSERGGGGIGLLFRECIRVNTVRSAEKEAIDYSELLVQLPTSCKLRIIIAYRRQPSENHRVPTSTFLKEFADLMERVILSKERFLLLGDFNIHVDVANGIDAVKFLDLLESLGLKQHVTEPTHIFDHRLDLGSTPRSGRYLSHHSAVCCSIRINKARPRPRG